MPRYSPVWIRHLSRRAEHFEALSHCKEHTVCSNLLSGDSYPALAPCSLLSMFYPHSHCSCTDLTWSKEAAGPLCPSAERAIDLCPECFPGCKTAKKVQNEEPHTIFLPAVCNWARNLPSSQRTCKLPQHTWATSSNTTLGIFFPTCSPPAELLHRSGMLPASTMPGWKQKSCMWMRH